MTDEMLSGSGLDPYKVAVLKSCWWCGSPGPLTHEHKFKKSDLLRMWEPGSSPVWGNNTELRQIRSARKSPEVRFDPGLCGPCNNDRSQPFDRAYQAFSDHVWDRPELWRADFLDMAQIYGRNWRAAVRNLGRYFAKHIGSRMAHDGFAVPTSLCAFLDGASHASDVQMVLFKSREHYQIYTEAQLAGVDAKGLWMDPAYGQVSRSRQRLERYSSSMGINFVGVMYRWEARPTGADRFYDHQIARLYWRHELPAG